MSHPSGHKNGVTGIYSEVEYPIKCDPLSSEETCTLHLGYEARSANRGKLYLYFREYPGFSFFAFYYRFCFVRFASHKYAKEALERNLPPGVKSLVIARHKYTVPYPQPDEYLDHSSVLHVTHLPAKYTSNEITYIFSSFNGFGGNTIFGKYGYIHFDSKASAEKAWIQLRSETNIVANYARNYKMRNLYREDSLPSCDMNMLLHESPGLPKTIYPERIQKSEIRAAEFEHIKQNPAACIRILQEKENMYKNRGKSIVSIHGVQDENGLNSMVLTPGSPIGYNTQLSRTFKEGDMSYLEMNNIDVSVSNPGKIVCYSEDRQEHLSASSVNSMRFKMIEDSSNKISYSNDSSTLMPLTPKLPQYTLVENPKVRMGLTSLSTDTLGDLGAGKLSTVPEVYCFKEEQAPQKGVKDFFSKSLPPVTILKSYLYHNYRYMENCNYPFIPSKKFVFLN